MRRAQAGSLCLFFLAPFFGAQEVAGAGDGRASRLSAARFEVAAPATFQTDAAAYYKQGDEHFQAGRYAEAVEAFKQLVKLRADVPQGHFYLGLAHYRLKQYAEAAAAFREAARLKPDWATAHNYLGNAYRQLGKPAEAVAAYREAVRANPALAEAHYKLALTYLEQNDRAAAGKTYETLKALDAGMAAKLKAALDK